VQKSNLKRTSQPWFDSECYIFKRDLLFLRDLSRQLHFQHLPNLEQEIANIYYEAKKFYRSLCSSKKRAAQEKRDNVLIQEAESTCHKFLQIDCKMNFIANDISLADWERNFDQILNERGLAEADSLDLKSLLAEYPKPAHIKYILEEEVTLALKGMKNKKAPGPDSLVNETLKILCGPLLAEITAFFNLCLKRGKFPSSWKNSSLKLLFKGKGSVSDMSNFRGINLSCSIYNLLDRVLKTRLYSCLAADIPRNQFGFVKGRSTIQAIKKLTDEINETVYNSAKRPLYALFLDIKKAFDSIDRKFIFQKLIDTKKLQLEELTLLAEMLDLNFVTIWDGVATSAPIIQSNGVKQGGSLSPLLFIFTLFNINDLLRDFPSVKLFLYADDFLALSDDLQDIQNFVDQLVPYLAERSLKLNEDKCKALKFRNKGRGNYKKTDKITINNRAIEFVTDFIYLGVKFQTSGTSFSKHIDKRVKAAIFATSKLNSLPKTSVETALKIFDLAVAPVASYGIEAIWPFLSPADLHTLETAKTRFLKKALCLSKFTKSRYVYELADTGLFIDDLRNKYSLPETESYNKFLINQSHSSTDIDLKFYDTPAMVNQNWKKACFENRHVFTRYACHGFHYVLCRTKNYHASATDTCVCSKCDQQIDLYHFLDCTAHNMSLTEASKWKR
jgi:Reverse transcriptase (RNA-dependent DNA polymerase)